MSRTANGFTSPLFIVFVSLYAATAQALLMIKPIDSDLVRTFAEGSWTKRQPLEDTEFGRILSKCGNEDYQCHSYHDGIEDRRVDSATTMSNLFFVVSLLDGDSFFCATSWSGLTLDCISRSVEDCVGKMPKKEVQAFFCKEMSRRHLDILESSYKSNVHKYLERLGRKAIGGLVDVDDEAPGFSRDTGLRVMFQRPIKGAMNEEILLYKADKDIYQHFAYVTRSDLMVRTCSREKDERREGRIDSVRDPLVLNVRHSYHSLFPRMHEEGHCLDYSRLAYSIPSGRASDQHYVCFGDLPRDNIGISRGGGLFCWKDEALNRDLRCDSVPAAAWHHIRYNTHSSAYTQVVFDEEHYHEWYADCPEESRNLVMGELWNIFEDIKQNPRERQAVKHHEL